MLVGAAVEELEKASSEADLLVLGSRGLGAFSGMLLGSVSDRVARRAACPVVVVRGDVWRTGPCYSAWTGRRSAATPSSPSPGPSGGCSRRRADRGAAPGGAGRRGGLPVAGGGVGTALRQMQEEALRSCVERHPAVPVEHRAVLAAAARALIGASDGCRLVVVGSRGRSGLLGDLTGSVSGHVLRHAHSQSRWSRLSAARRRAMATIDPVELQARVGETLNRRGRRRHGGGRHP